MSETESMKTIAITIETAVRLDRLRIHLNAMGVKGTRIAEDSLIQWLLDHYYQSS